MTLRKVLASVAVTFAVTTIACGSETGNGGPSNAGDASRAGSAAPDFTARDTDGNTVRLSQFLGKQAVLLDFCATWCEPCVAEFPHLRKLYAENKAKGFVVMAVAMDGPETVGTVPAFAKRNQLDFPVLTDDDSHIASLYNPKKAAPLSVLIDKNGKIVAIREGYNTGDEKFLREDVEKILDGAGAPQ